MFKRSPKIRIRYHKPVDIGLWQIVANTLIFCGIYILFLTYSGNIWSEIVYRWDEFRGVRYQLGNIDIQETTLIPINQANIVKIQPVNTEFSIVIESINVNAPIVKDVSVLTERVYMDALKKGVAHAAFSDYPSENAAQVYLFAHSSNNFWQLGPFSTVFNHLDKLNQGDQINVFYEGKRYLYQVDSLSYTDNFKIDDTIFNQIGPVLILQTCYPPGSTQYRLIVKSSLIGVSDYRF